MAIRKAPKLENKNTNKGKQLSKRSPLLKPRAASVRRYRASVKGAKVPNVSIDTDTREIKDYTSSYLVRKAFNGRGNFRLELENSKTGELIYKVLCKDDVSFVNQFKYVCRTYGKRNINSFVREYASDFTYPPKGEKAPALKKEIIPEVKAIVVEPSILDLKKDIIQEAFKLIAEHVDKAASTKVSHNSTTLITFTITSDAIAKGEHIIKVDYNTRKASYFYEGKKIKTRDNLYKLLK